ncbi:hypothetical protein Tco_1146611, partial [Tanacetum coccineum]
IEADALIKKFKDRDDEVKRNIHSWFVTSQGKSTDLETGEKLVNEMSSLEVKSL